MAEAVLLGGFRVWLGSATSAGVSVRLERSADGRAWARVPGSGNGQPGEVTVAGAQVLSRRLGVGATVDHAAKGALVGNRHYRIVLTAPSEAPARVELRDVSWSLSGSRRYRNSGAVVALYRYLLEGARTALNDGPGVPAAQLLRAPTLTRARADGSRIGPVRWMGPVPARVRVLGSAPAFIVDDAGERVEQLIPEQEYSLVIGPVAATGELSIQLSYELERPEALVLRGQSEARSGRMSPLVTVENSTLSHGFTQRLILVAEAR